MRFIDFFLLPSLHRRKSLKISSNWFLQLQLCIIFLLQAQAGSSPLLLVEGFAEMFLRRLAGQLKFGGS